MANNKSIFASAVLAITILLISSCSGASKKAQETAEGFLSSYFKMDYSTAYSFCDAELSETLQMTVEATQTTDSQILERIREASAATTFKITEIDTESVEDRAYIKYEIYAPNIQNPIAKSLTLSKVGRDWKVSELR